MILGQYPKINPTTRLSNVVFFIFVKKVKKHDKMVVFSPFWHISKNGPFFAQNWDHSGSVLWRPSHISWRFALKSHISLAKNKTKKVDFFTKNDPKMGHFYVVFDKTTRIWHLCVKNDSFLTFKNDRKNDEKTSFFLYKIVPVSGTILRRHNQQRSKESHFLWSKKWTANDQKIDHFFRWKLSFCDSIFHRIRRTTQRYS